MNHLYIRFSSLTSAALAASLLLAVACGSDSKGNDNPTPSNGVGGSAATGGAAAETGGATADTGGAAADTGGTSAATGGAADTAGAANTGGAANGTGGSETTTGGNSSATGGAAIGGASSTGTSTTCTHDTNRTCYECPPTTNDQILTACSDVICRPFDNTGRGVPAALPAVP